MKIKMLILLLLAVTIFSCSKDKKKSGDHVYCKIDGKEWSAESDGSIFDKSKLISLGDDGKSLLITGHNSDEGVTELVLLVYDSVTALTSKNYELTEGQYQNYNKGNRYDYSTDSTHKGYASINIEEGGKRVSGSFSFTAKLKNSDEVISVTEGSFNLPL